ncbi:MAG: fenitrothion hydrolase [Actinobacteria bacterium]|nr:fenitrothion hydrolase [Actinomycetota bacterium]
MDRRPLAVLLTVAGTLAVVPEAALAHGIVGREDLPIPKWLFGWAATAVLVVSFVGLAVLWPRPRLEEASERRVASLPRLLDPICGAVGVALFAFVVYAGFAGSQDPATNIVPTFVFVIFWIGVAVLSLLFGDVFHAFNPWRAIARAAAAIATKVSRGGLPAPMPYPAMLGRWPAAIGIFAFVWLELVYPDRTDPSKLAVLALAYAAIQLVGTSLYGIAPWTRYGDAFGSFYGLFARMSPLRWERGALYVRAPLSGLTKLDAVPGTVALLCVMIGTTSFDGFSAGPAWGEIAPRMTDSLRGIGFSQSASLQVAFTIGLIVVVAIVAGLIRLGIAGMRNASHVKLTTDELAARFAHTLVPIALAYIVAHYFSLLFVNGQAIGYLASDPLGRGSNVFGTAQWTVDYGWISANAIWYVQVGALVAGHVAGLAIAHDRAIALFPARAALRSQYALLVLMVAYTVGGLWLLSQD